jgi:tetratricopeptide (TPR) repeat protein
VDHKVNLEEALKWADKSIESEERFDNYLTKSKVLKALSRPDEATTAFNKAVDLAQPIQLYIYGRQLQFQKQKDQAMDIYRMAAKRFPDHWISHIGLARVDSAAGDFPGAIKEIKAAQTIGVVRDQQSNVQTLLERLQKNQDINNR